MRNVLPAYRARRGWSQQRLAEELGVSRQTVISIEKGRFDPSLPVAFRLAAVFGCRIEDLFDPGVDGAGRGGRGQLDDQPASPLSREARGRLSVR